MTGWRSAGPPWVAAGFLDVLYDFRRVSIAGNIIFGPQYQNARSGSVQLPGLIDEAGALQTGGVPLGADEVLLFSVPLTANSTGLVNFVGDPADLTTDAARRVCRLNTIRCCSNHPKKWGSSKSAISTPA